MNEDNNNVSRIYREQSLLIIETLELVRTKKLSNIEYQQMLLILLADYAEFLWSTADLMDSVSQMSDIKFVQKTKFTDPPFDKDFFKNHKDI